MLVAGMSKKTEVLTINKSSASAKTGITLMSCGNEPPFVSEVASDGCASGVVQRSGVVLKVNGKLASGHEAATKIIKDASGKLTIEVCRNSFELAVANASARKIFHKYCVSTAVDENVS